MTREKFKDYMELRENAENLWGAKLIEQEKYEEICTIILERIAREDEFGNTNEFGDTLERKENK